MSEQIGRLLFTRKDGESFHIGEDTIVTVHRVPGPRARVEVLRADRTGETFEVAQREPFFPAPGVHVELSFDHNRGKGTKVMALAPKSIRIMRSELLDARPRAQAASV